MRFGLCCIFVRENIRFRTTTAKALADLPRVGQLAKLSELCLHNAENLLAAVRAVHRLGFGAFRILSGLFPRMTHPQVGYALDDLPAAEAIAGLLNATRTFAAEHAIRLSFHPDQFILLSSPKSSVTANSLRELECQATWARAVGAEVITIHGGGVYGDKAQALDRLRRAFGHLSEDVTSRLALENDDTGYTPLDLLPVCAELAIPMVYDVHHHRCLPDSLSIEEATLLAGQTWAVGREQYCHISSPKNGWGPDDPKPHADYIDPADVPECWLGRPMTVDVEAKAKELAILRLMQDLDGLKH